jgi:hypothetical protein
VLRLGAGKLRNRGSVVKVVPSLVVKELNYKLTLVPFYYEDLKNIGVILHSPIRLHGV